MEKCYEYKLKELIHAFVKEFSVGITRQEINDYIYPQMAEDLKRKITE